jgi:GTP-binding protein
MAQPLIAIVGRPNVGKSTLFNRLAGERLAVIDDIPGTTRDRLTARSEWNGISFNIVDTGGIDPTSLSGGSPLSIGSKDYIKQIRSQAELAARESDAIIFLVDVEAGVTPTDQEVASLLRRLQTKREGLVHPPILLVANKCDSAQRTQEALAFYELGLGEPCPISALHGFGTGDMLDRLLDLLPDLPEIEEEGQDQVREPKLAIVGRPNVGKSTLLNQILGEERVLVSSIPGTTRDAVDTSLEFEGTTITLIDTAGIRRRGRIEPGVEKYSVLRAHQAIERADVALLLIDALEGVTAQDTHIAGTIRDKYRSVVLLINKWDTINKDSFTYLSFSEQIKHELNFMDYIPVLFISALTGQRVDQVLPLALDVYQARFNRIPTGQLNRLINNATLSHAPPSKSGRRLKILYSSQVDTDPPIFVFSVNDPDLVHFSYARYLENRIRAEYEFLGTPIRMTFRARSGRSG